MAKQKEKTNVMRVLEQKKILYTAYTYPHEEGIAVDGVTVAQEIGQPPEQVFKTLLTQGASKEYYVFVIPVACQLDLKKGAKAVGEKSLALVPVTSLQPLTGYIRGGCSPVGMKKRFYTTFHQSVLEVEQVVVSAGKIGHQVGVNPRDLLELVGGHTADLIVNEG